jgi:hypothetical protein
MRLRTRPRHSWGETSLDYFLSASPANIDSSRLTPVVVSIELSELEFS